MTDRQSIRAAIRQQRQQLTAAENQAASQQLSNHLANTPLFLRSQHIAVYVANDGEIDPLPLVKQGQALNKRFYLPVLTADKLDFRHYQLDAPMTLNHCGIPEPHEDHSHTHPITELDLVLLPLVAFDGRGNRLGMGAGYYDKSFAFLNAPERTARTATRSLPPVLLGLAYDFQQVDAIASQAWDVPLQGIVTESGLRFF